MSIIKTSKKLIMENKLKATGTLIGSAYATHEFSKEAKENGTGSAITKTGALIGASLLTSPVLVAGAYIGTHVGKTVLDVGKKGYDVARLTANAGTAQPFSGARFVDTKETYTMRQAAMVAIGQTRGDLENAMLGNEANRLHR